MALVDEVIARWSTQRLRELTTPDDNTATAYDATRLAKAAMDAKNEFLRRTGVTYDETSNEHHTVGVKGVLAYLLEFRGMAGSEAGRNAIQEWRDALQAWARTGGGANQVVQPMTNSYLQPTTEGLDRVTRPDFDRSVMTDLVPRQPNSDSEE